jgi:prepilin-type N-terminal cleavage/methylation domain-containing protein
VREIAGNVEMRESALVLKNWKIAIVSHGCSYEHFDMTNSRAFTLTETLIAVVILAIISLGGAALSVSFMREYQGQLAKNESLQQVSQLKSFLLTAPTAANSDSCVSRLGLTGSEIYDPAHEFELSNLDLEQISQKLKVKRIYFARPAFQTTSGSENVYYAQLLASHAVEKIEGNENQLRPMSLGMMRITANAAGRITSCNWDSSTEDPNAFCTTAGMMVSENNTCIPMVQQTPIEPGTCPIGTTLDSTINRCIPSSTDCAAQNLSDNFDGNRMFCTNIPTTHVVTYPQGYTPPALPTISPTGTTPIGTPGGTPGPGGMLPVASTPVPNCLCGTTSLSPGDPRLCVRATNNEEICIFDCPAYDDIFYVKTCNTSGALQTANPPGYFLEDGNGVSWNWRVGTCTSYGGTKNVGGQIFRTGRCL